MLDFPARSDERAPHFLANELHFLAFLSERNPTKAPRRTPESGGKRSDARSMREPSGNARRKWKKIKRLYTVLHPTTSCLRSGAWQPGYDIKELSAKASANTGRRRESARKSWPRRRTCTRSISARLSAES